MDRKDLPLIVTDLDGVLVNIMDEVIANLYQTFGVTLMHEDCVEYSVHDSFFDRLSAHFRSVEALNQYLIRNCWANPALLARCKPYWDMLCALHVFKDLGGKIVGLTGRAPTSRIKQATLDWMARWGFPKVEVLFAREGAERGLSESEAKLAECENIILDSPGTYIWFLDDQPATCAMVAGASRLKNITVYMLERPWTRNRYGLGGVKKRYIIQDIEALVEKVQEQQ